MTETQSVFHELGTQVLNVIYIHFNLKTMKHYNTILGISI